MTRSRSAIVDDITTVTRDSPAGSQLSSRQINKLAVYRDELIDLFGWERLQRDPFLDTRSRSLNWDTEEVGNRLLGRRILVTGGSGFVGTELRRRLLDFAPAAVVSFDNSEHLPMGQQVDVSERSSVYDAMSDFRPEIVFHLAAERLPGVAEKRIHRTVATNVAGTANVLQAAAAFGASDFVFCSTGKASRYLTSDVYAGTKKLAEWLVIAAADIPNFPARSIVRFTHVVENSPVAAELMQKASTGLVNMHSANRFFYTQNVNEAVSLLLYASKRTAHTRTPILAVRELGWPIDALEVGLHIIATKFPGAVLTFDGLPPGYREPYFYGQSNPHTENETSSLTNALETRIHGTEPVFFEVSPANCSADVLTEAIQSVQEAISAPAEVLRRTLSEASHRIARGSFRAASADDLVDLIRWGASPVNESADALCHHREILAMLVDAIRGRLTADCVDQGNRSAPRLQSAIENMQTGLGAEFTADLHV